MQVCTETGEKLGGLCLHRARKRNGFSGEYELESRSGEIGVEGRRNSIESHCEGRQEQSALLSPEKGDKPSNRLHGSEPSSRAWGRSADS